MATVVKAPCRISKITKHTSEIMSLDLEPQKKIPRYNPGQFLHFAIDRYDPSFAWPESRVFSIANYDPTFNTLRITFGIKGAFTSRMFHCLNEGDIVWIKLPYGDFTFKPISDQIVLLAGGTGITPYASFLESLLNSEEARKIILYYGVQNIDKLIYADFLKQVQEKITGFTSKIYVEDNKSEDNGFQSGRLDINSIYSETKKYDMADYYISGPPEMINYFKGYLLDQGVQQDLVHIDDWF